MISAVRRSRSLLRALFVSSFIQLTACSGGHDAPVASSAPAAVPLLASPAAAPSAPSDTSAVPVRLNYILPSSAASTTEQTAGARRRQFISAANTLISITVTPLGGSATVYGPTACTSGSCAISFTATPGANTIAFRLTDGSSNVLSQFSTTTIVQPATINTLNFSANPVVNRVTLSLAVPTLNAGTAASDLLSVNALDAAGNTIVGNDGFVDASGNPLSLTLNVANAQAGGSGRVSIVGPSRITKPGQAVSYARYDGNRLDSATISVSATRAIAGTLGSTTLTTVPTAIQYNAGAANPHGIATGPDGNIWYTDFNNPGLVGRMTPTGGVSVFSTSVANQRPIKILAGPDGTMWYTYGNTGVISRSTLGGTSTNVGSLSNAGVYGTAVGFDGALWFGEGAAVVARVTSAGTITEYSSGITPGTSVTSVTRGPDGAMWFAEQEANKIGRIDTSGKITEFSSGMLAGRRIYALTLGRDNNVWFAECGTSCGGSGNDAIGRITSGGVVSHFTTNLSTAGLPRNMISGPDGNVWFCEDSGGKLGRITPDGTITEFSNGFGVTRIIDLTLGPDGNIWFSGFSIGMLEKFVL